MPQKHRVEDSWNRAGGCRALLDRLGVVFIFYEIRQSSQEVARLDRCAVEVNDALQKYPEAGYAAGENKPHEGAAFLHKFHHSGFGF
jgi:hypothetical protein